MNFGPLGSHRSSFSVDSYGALSNLENNSIFGICLAIKVLALAYLVLGAALAVADDLKFDCKKNPSGHCGVRESGGISSTARSESHVRTSEDDAYDAFIAANALSREKRWSEAEPYYRQAIALSARYAPACYYNLGNALFWMKRYAEAETAFQQAIRLNHKNDMAHANLCATLQRLRRYDEAETACYQALKLNKKNQIALNNLEALGKKRNEEMEDKQWEAALDRFLKCETAANWACAEQAAKDAIPVSYGQGYSMLAEALEKQGRFREALAAYRQYRPGDISAAVRYMADIATDRLKADPPRYQAAEECYQLSLEIDPSNAVIRRGLIDVLGAEYIRLNSVEALPKLIKLAPTVPLYRQTFGLELVKKGRVEDGVRELREALRLNPNIIYDGYEFLVAISTLREAGRYDASAELAREVLDHIPSEQTSYRSSFQSDIAWALDLKGDKSASEAAYRAAVAIDPQNRHTHDYLKDFLIRNAEYDAAEAEVVQMMSLFPAYSEEARRELDKIRELKAAAANRQEVQAGPDLSPRSGKTTPGLQPFPSEHLAKAETSPTSGSLASVGGTPSSALEQAQAAKEYGKQAKATEGEPSNRNASVQFDTKGQFVGGSDDTSVVRADLVKPREFPKWVYEDVRVKQQKEKIERLQRERDIAEKDLKKEEAKRQKADLPPTVSESDAKEKLMRAEYQLAIERPRLVDLSLQVEKEGPPPKEKEPENPKQ